MMLYPFTGMVSEVTASSAKDGSCNQHFQMINSYGDGIDDRLSLFNLGLKVLARLEFGWPFNRRFKFKLECRVHLIY